MCGCLLIDLPNLLPYASWNLNAKKKTVSSCSTSLTSNSYTVQFFPPGELKPIPPFPLKKTKTKKKITIKKKNLMQMTHSILQASKEMKSHHHPHHDPPGKIENVGRQGKI